MFKKNFIWGVSTAAPQIEGGAFEDGRGPSIWDTLALQKGKIARGDTPTVACDHYHHVDEDIELMAKIGVKAYRMSISWSRIFPEGTVKVNQKGVDFYHRIFDKCLSLGITPYATLYHWDLPQALHEKGGWMNRDIVNWFGEYASLIGKEYSDKITNFIPFNEQTCALVLGYYAGCHAPAFTLSKEECNRISHYMLLAQGTGNLALRANSKQPLSIGTAIVANVRTPMSNSLEDLEAARQATFDPNKWAENGAWWLDPLFLGDYIQQKTAGNESYFDAVKDGDLKIIASPFDYIGLNIYNSFPARATLSGIGNAGSFSVDAFPSGFPKTCLGWPLTPEALYYGVKFYAERYKQPIVITENGAAFDDWVCLDGKVHDPQRADFIARYLKELKKAAKEFDVDGYFYWTWQDNFEWNNGLDKRFGMVYVDFQTQRRTLKDSAYFYGDIIKNNGNNL